MNFDENDVNFEELARSTDDFNDAQVYYNNYVERDIGCFLDWVKEMRWDEIKIFFSIFFFLF